MIVLYYLFFLLVHITTAQFPDHLDLQRVGEIIFNNEKYNVLKPTRHKVTDHFKDFMLRRGNKDKNERIYLDDNGFRHIWSGLGVKSKSLRKTEISFYEVNKNTENGENPISGARDSKEDIYSRNVNIEDTTVKIRRKPKRPKTSLEEDREEEESKKQMLRETADKKTSSGGRKIAITSFFCPFFGVIKMTSFID